MSSPRYTSVIPITGTIGSGKSTFCSILEELGANVVYADKLAHQALVNLQADIVANFGTEILTNGSVDRSKLGKIVFADSTRRKTLEAIVHPEVRRLAAIEFDRLLSIKSDSGQNDFVFYEVPLFFETEMQSLGFGPSVLITVVSDDEAVKRIVARGKESAEQAQSRIAAQMPVKDKIALADIVIDNSGTKVELMNEAVGLLQKLRLGHSKQKTVIG